jgi:hypothetical protein
MFTHTHTPLPSKAKIMARKFKLVWVVYVCMMVTLVSLETAYVTYMVYVVQKCSVYGRQNGANVRSWKWTFSFAWNRLRNRDKIIARGIVYPARLFVYVITTSSGLISQCW